MTKKRYLLSIILCACLLSSFLPLSAVAATGFDVEEIYDSVFVVYTDSSVGSGFSIGSNTILTNAHVIENAEYVYVSTYGGETYTAFVYIYDDYLDLALLVVGDVSLKPLKIGSVNDLKIGDDIYTIGAPNSMAYTLTKGVISAKERTIRRQDYIQIDAAINAGNSGGPLLNDFGEVIGINTLKMSDSEGIGLAIPIERAIEYLCDNGITVDSSNNITGKIETSNKRNEDSEPEADISNSPEYQGNVSAKKINSALVIALVFSVLTNVVLLIILFIRRKEKQVVTIDPSERTDFEIEIEE